MAKITKTKYTFEVEHSGPAKDFDDIVLRMSRRVKNYTATVVETKTETVRKPKEVTKQQRETQTIKKILMECLQEIGMLYVSPNQWHDSRTVNSFSLRVRNQGYGAPGIEIYNSVQNNWHHKISYVAINPNKGTIDFKRYVGGGDICSINLADPNSLTQIKDLLKKNFKL